MLYLPLILYTSLMLLVFKVVTYIVKILDNFFPLEGDIINWNFEFKSRYEMPHQGMLYNLEFILFKTFTRPLIMCLLLAR